MQRLSGVLRGCVIAFLSAGALCVAVATAVGVANFRDVGYPDSANLIRIDQLVHSGRLYPDIDRPPYLLTLYGPLTYLFLAAPYALAQAAGGDPRIAVRLAELAALAACLRLIFLIGRRVYGSRPIAWLCVLFAASIEPFAAWTTQLRGDLPAAAASLLAVYLVAVSRGRARFIAAAICGGLAILVKQTFWASSIAIVVWLLYRRRFQDAALWVTCLVLTVGCGYGLALWREPLGMQHLAAMGRTLPDYRGALKIVADAVRQPVALFAVLGAWAILRKRAPQALLLMIYCLAAWLVAILTVVQVGANFNYFWEPLLSSALLAGAGLCRLQPSAARIPALGLALLLIPLYWVFRPALGHDYSQLRRSYREIAGYRSRQAQWESFVRLVAGKRLLSTFPDVTIHSATPEMPDPFLNSVLERRGAWNSSPVVAAIDAGSYDMLVIGAGEASAPRLYRGIPLWSDPIWSAVKREYRPACAFAGSAQEPDQNMEVWLPARRAGDVLPGRPLADCAPRNARGN